MWACPKVVERVFCQAGELERVSVDESVVFAVVGKGSCVAAMMVKRMVGLLDSLWEVSAVLYLAVTLGSTEAVKWASG